MKIEFTSYDQGASEFFPPVPAHKIIPDWYKEMDLSTEWQNDRVVPTVKRCVPVRDYLTCGYAILNPYETQLRFENDETNTLKASNVCPAEDYVSAHPYNQCPINMHGKRNHYFKLANVWKVKTPPGYSCHFYQPYFMLNQDYDFFPAIVDTDGHNDAVNFVGVGKRKNFTIPAGAPLMIVYPFKRDDWEMSHKYEDYTQSNAYKFYIKKAWHATYQRLFHSKKRFK